VYPATWAGRAVTMVAIFFAIVFTAMPISIVGGNFKKEWDERERRSVIIKIQKSMINQNMVRAPAPSTASSSPLPALLLDTAPSAGTTRGTSCTHPWQVIDDISSLFSRHDPTGQGAIGFMDFISLLRGLEIYLSVQASRKVYLYFDVNGDDAISYKEFCNVVFPDYDVEGLSALELAKACRQSQARCSTASKADRWSTMANTRGTVPEHVRASFDAGQFGRDGGADSRAGLASALIAHVSLGLSNKFEDCNEALLGIDRRLDHLEVSNFVGQTGDGGGAGSGGSDGAAAQASEKGGGWAPGWMRDAMTA
jgi:hypothetical protein